MNTVEHAREALSTAQEIHTTASDRVDAARLALDASEVAIGDTEAAATVQDWLAAKQENELAALALRGSARRLEIARADLDCAEIDEARATIERCLTPASRADTFARCLEYVAVLAETLPPDANDEEIGAHAIEQTRARREVAQILASQVDAVTQLNTARVRLGEPVLAIAPVTFAEIEALVQLEQMPDDANTWRACQRILATVVPPERGIFGQSLPARPIVLGRESDPREVIIASACRQIQSGVYERDNSISGLAGAAMLGRTG